MTPTDTIIALEKALEDQLRRLQEFAHDEVSVHVTRGQLRTLLDAHASALRDAARYRYLRDSATFHEARNILNDMPVGIDEAVDAGIARHLAALDDNTKGAAE